MKNPFRGLRFSLLDFHNANAGLGMKIAFAAICCIPLIYGALYLAAFYDPYGNIDKVPVVVVNKDEGWEIEGETLKAGDSVVDQLKSADALDFTYDNDEEAARAGLEAGTYYMELIIPEDFSECVASATTDEPKQAHFDLIANQSANSIATTMGLSAFRVITSKVNYAIGEDFYVNIFDMIDESSSAIKVAADGSAELADGLVGAQEGSQTLTDALGTASTGATALDSGLGQLTSGLAAGQQGASALASGMDQLQSGSSQLAAGTDQLASGASSLSDGLSTLDSGASQVSAGASGVKAGANQLLESLSSLNENQLAQLSDGAFQVAGGLSQLKEGFGDVSGAIDQTSGYVSSAATILDQATSATVEGVTTYTLTAEQYNQLSGALGAASQYAAGAKAGAGTVSDSIGQLADGASSVNGGISELRGAVSEGGDLYNGVAALAAGASQVADGASQVAAGASSANDGASSLAVGASQVNTGAQQLNSGIGSAADGASQLAAGTSQLAAGAAAAQTGASALASGLVQLQDGSNTLTEGLGGAVDGAQALADGLAEGYEAAQDSTENSGARAEMMSEPVSLDQTEYTTVTNYGSGFAPYFIALGLWVGALMCTFITKPLNGRLIASGASPLVAAFSGLVPSALIGMIQALVMAAVLQFGLHIDLLHPGPYYALCLLTAVCFAAWNQMLVSTLGLPGKFLSVVLLMLQLTSAAGTFPLQVVPGFFQAINPLLPMTYAVRALRVATTGLDLSMITPNVWMLLLFAAIPFAITTLHAARKRIVTLNDLHPLVQLAE